MKQSIIAFTYTWNRYHGCSDIPCDGIPMMPGVTSSRRCKAYRKRSGSQSNNIHHAIPRTPPVHLHPGLAAAPPLALAPPGLRRAALAAPPAIRASPDPHLPRLLLHRLERLGRDPDGVHARQPRAHHRLRHGRAAPARVRARHRQPRPMDGLLPPPGPRPAHRHARPLPLLRQAAVALGPLSRLGSVGHGHAARQSPLDRRPARDGSRLSRRRAASLADVAHLLLRSHPLHRLQASRSRSLDATARPRPRRSRPVPAHQRLRGERAGAPGRRARARRVRRDDRVCGATSTAAGHVGVPERADVRAERAGAPPRRALAVLRPRRTVRARGLAGRRRRARGLARAEVGREGPSAGGLARQVGAGRAVGVEPVRSSRGR
nr:hypothetical protein CFP56_10045 [Quercus suber]